MYTFEVRLQMPFVRAVVLVREALRDEGFGVAMEIDVQALFREKLGVSDRPYLILGACNPGLAREAIARDPDIGVLLPCNVVVRSESDVVTDVVFMDPAAVLGLTGEANLVHLAEEVRMRLFRVRERLDFPSAST
ncbi:Uncharacterized conserved protein UCP021774 [mine drainage metagenome]|uniref:Uncharacterized conserved protein UCP021774 n=1 Tax=mine drainage metagenome TaxID=410659 RepID=T1D636_9ZZZZ